jgi:hypothetical protein
MEGKIADDDWLVAELAENDVTRAAAEVVTWLQQEMTSPKKLACLNTMMVLFRSKFKFYYIEMADGTGGRERGAQWFLENCCYLDPEIDPSEERLSKDFDREFKALMAARTPWSEATASAETDKPDFLYL